ncbi:MAG: hypothetical protein ACREDL_21945 [Bradyrhizobium sp.]
MKRVAALALDRRRRTRHHQRPATPRRQPMSDRELAVAIRKFRRGTLAGAAKWKLSTSMSQVRFQEDQQGSGALIRRTANSDAGQLHSQADECRRLALEAKCESDRAAWLRLAAERAESSRRI